MLEEWTKLKLLGHNTHEQKGFITTLVDMLQQCIVENDEPEICNKDTEQNSNGSNPTKLVTPNNNRMSTINIVWNKRTSLERSTVRGSVKKLDPLKKSHMLFDYKDTNDTAVANVTKGTKSFHTEQDNYSGGSLSGLVEFKKELQLQTFISVLKKLNTWKILQDLIIEEKDEEDFLLKKCNPIEKKFVINTARKSGNISLVVKTSRDNSLDKSIKGSHNLIIPLKPKHSIIGHIDNEYGLNDHNKKIGMNKKSIHVNLKKMEKGNKSNSLRYYHLKEISSERSISSGFSARNEKVINNSSFKINDLESSPLSGNSYKRTNKFGIPTILLNKPETSRRLFKGKELFDKNSP